MGWVLAPLALALVVVVAACSGSPGRLTADRRVRDLDPAPGSTTTNPVVLRWSTTITPEDDLAFAVFLDTSMAPPGATVQPGGGTYVTSGTSVDVGELPPGPHRFFVAIVDAQGVRQGGVAWNAAFTVE